MSSNKNRNNFKELHGPQHTSSTLNNQYVWFSMHEFNTMFLIKMIYTTGVVITLLLGSRFLLFAAGASASNTIINALYRLSGPLVTPFVGMINYQPQYGISRFDFESLIALAFYSLIGWIVLALVTTDAQE